MHLPTEAWKWAGGDEAEWSVDFAKTMWPEGQTAAEDGCYGTFVERGKKSTHKKWGIAKCETEMYFMCSFDSEEQVYKEKTEITEATSLFITDEVLEENEKEVTSWR